MVVVPFGILKQQNGNSHFQSTQIATQKQMQQTEQKENNESSVNSVMDIVKEHSELSIEGDKIVMKKKIEPVDVFYVPETVHNDNSTCNGKITEILTSKKGPCLYHSP